MAGDNEVRKSSESQKKKGGRWWFTAVECGLIHQANASCGAKRLELIPDRCEVVDWLPTEAYPCVSWCFWVSLTVLELSGWLKLEGEDTPAAWRGVRFDGRIAPVSSILVGFRTGNFFQRGEHRAENPKLSSLMPISGPWLLLNSVNFRSQEF